eukprot:6180515-Pleurochrysis_carterae.AAC.2
MASGSFLVTKPADNVPCPPQTALVGSFRHGQAAPSIVPEVRRVRQRLLSNYANAAAMYFLKASHAIATVSSSCNSAVAAAGIVAVRARLFVSVRIQNTMRSCACAT